MCCLIRAFEFVRTINKQMREFAAAAKGWWFQRGGWVCSGCGNGVGAGKTGSGAAGNMGVGVDVREGDLRLHTEL